jgi:HD-GYP domain-containing protein (c-di-GMP phosphodiesterase class II)
MPDAHENPMQALSTAALRALMAAIGQRRIYPPQHPIASRALTSLAFYLERILAQSDEWRLAIVGRRLMAAGSAVLEDESVFAPFVEDLKARGIETISFRRGVEVEELRRFISLLILDPRALGGTPLAQRLAQEGIRSIEAGQLVLESKGEAAARRAAEDETDSDISEAYDNALTFVQETILGFREGRKISLKEAEDFVHSMITQMRQDRSPCLILTTLKAHHAYTFTHIINVCILTVAQIEALGADAATLRQFGLASMMHDIGKSLLPTEVLSKPGKLTPEEFGLIQRHPQDGVHILAETPGVPDLALIVALEHHMRYNHDGYPRVGRPRPLHPCSLMTNLADTYDAMRSRRPYQAEFPPEEVAAVITDRSGRDFHPQLAQAFLQMMGAYPPGTRVKLDTGEEGMVARVNPTNPYRPIVRILKNSSGRTVRKMDVVDLMQKEQVGGRFTRNILRSITAPAPGTEKKGASGGTPGAASGSQPA